MSSHLQMASPASPASGESENRTEPDAFGKQDFPMLSIQLCAFSQVNPRRDVMLLRGQSSTEQTHHRNFLD